MSRHIVVMFMVKKVHQSLLPLQHRTGRTIWTSEGWEKVVTTLSRHFFLFSKCLICLTHSHNVSAVSLIFFCDSEYDQSLVPRSHYLFGQHQERPDICAWRDWNMIMYSCLLRQCRKCFTVFRLKTYGDRAFSIAGPKL